MIHLEGQQTFPQAVADVSAKLSDAGFIANCIPDSQVTEATPDRSVGKLKPKLSFLTGSLTLEAEVTAREPGQAVAYRIFSKTMGASSTVETKLAFSEAEGGGTTVQWSGDIVAVTGLLKMVPKGLLEGTAKKVIEDLWTAIRAKLAQAS